MVDTLYNIYLELGQKKVFATAVAWPGWCRSGRDEASVWHVIDHIWEEDRPTIRAINPRTWIKNTNYPDLEFQPSFQAFTAQRAELLARLEPLAPEDWRRGAIVTGAGKPLERTVQFYAQWLAEHERSHLKQFKRIVNTMRLH